MPAHTNPLTIIWGFADMYSNISKIHLEQSSFITGSDKLTGSNLSEVETGPLSCLKISSAYHSSNLSFKKLLLVC